MTPRLPGTPDRTERAYACPVCGYWLERKQNPSYGTGLAVHPYILVCGKCGWANLELAPATEAQAPAPRRRGFLAWLGFRHRG